MVEAVITRDGKRYETQWALDNSFAIGYPRAYIQAVLDEADRPYDGTVHVTDMVGCLRRNVYKKKLPYAVDLEGASNTLVGTALHDYFTHGDTEHKVFFYYQGVPISGSIDNIEKTDNGLILWDFKGAKSFKVMKTLGITKIPKTVFDEDGNPVKYKTGAKAGQVKTRKEVNIDPKNVEADDYEQQLNVYKYLLLSQIQDGRDPVYTNNDMHIYKMFIFFVIKDFGKDSSMNGIESNTVPAEIKFWSLPDILSFMERAHIIHDCLSGNRGIPDMGVGQEIWYGRMCENFCEFRDHCRKNGGIK